MTLFDEFKNKLPPFTKFLSNLYDINSTTHFDVTAYIAPLGELLRKMFHPRGLEDTNSTAIMVELSKILTKRWVVEMIHKKVGT